MVRVDKVSHRYGKAVALDAISLDIPKGLMVGVIGPDGVGKSTLLGIMAGAKQLQEGSMTVLGGQIGDARHRRAVCPRIAYMPQGLGKNLYFELSVWDNVDFMARLFGLPAAERPVKIKELLHATGLGPFPDRPAGKLSGGMKQKVGLCGALVHDPDLLILDEPTTGVDPLSRRQFWALIDDIRVENPGMSVVIATAYMDEAQQWDWLVAMDGGKVLATGTPAELMSRTGTSNLEKCFIALLPEEKRRGHKELVIPPRKAGATDIAIDAKGLTKSFGDFTAVHQVTLSIERGEIFGFLGSNGCGKSTTMKMLTGLLPPTEGSATLFGKPVEADSLEVRNNLGYMTQSFSLYGEMTIRQNLVLHARLYHLPPEKAKSRIAALVERFGLGSHLDALAEELPMGLRQRLSLAVAVLHEPQILILDEPTSGVDPVARDSFWELLIDLSRNQGVTIFVTTHFMNEGMRCDRISLMNAGKVLVSDAPQKIIDGRGSASLEEAFIAYMEDSAGEIAAQTGSKDLATSPSKAPEAIPATPAAVDAAAAAAATPAEEARAAHAPGSSPWGLRVGRTLAYSRNETMQILRDPVRLVFAFVGSALLMLVFGFGITTDVEHIRYATLDLDKSADSRTYLEQFAAPTRYFTQTPPAASAEEALNRLKSDDISMVLEVPPGFGSDLRRGAGPEVLAQVDAAMTFRGETVGNYAQAVHQTLLKDPATGLPFSGMRKYTAEIEERYMYNPSFESIFSIVPRVPSLLLLLIPAILMTVAIVREKELGSMINFYVTPTGKLEYLLGKQLPYVAIGMLNFFIMAALTLIVFNVPVKGSFLMLTLCTLLYVMATTGLGMVTSTFTKSQVAAVFVTAILTIVPTIQFSGLLQPVSTLEGNARRVGTVWPATYYMHSSLGAYTKGLGPGKMLRGHLLPRRHHPGPPGAQPHRPQEAGEIVNRSLVNILWLGLKEIRSLLSDVVMVVFVIYAFTLGIYIQATGTSSEVNNASIAFVDEDRFRPVQGTLQLLLPSPLQGARIHPLHPGRRGHGQGDVPVRRLDSARFRAGPPRRTQSLGAGEHRRHRHAAGRHRRGLHQEHRRRPDRVLPGPDRRLGAQARLPRGAQAVQSERHLLVVQERRGHHQPDHPADGGADGRRGHPRARARHARAPAGDAADGLRNRHGEGLGQRARDPDRRHRLAVPDSQDGPQGPVRRIDGPLVLRRRALPVLRHGAGDIPGDHLAIHGAIRAPHHPGRRGDDAVVGRIDPGGEPAEVAAVLHLLPAVAPIRELLAGDHLPGRRLRRRLAPVLHDRRGRAGLLRLQPLPVPQIHRGDQVAGLFSAARCGLCPVRASRIVRSQSAQVGGGGIGGLEESHQGLPLIG